MGSPGERKGARSLLYDMIEGETRAAGIYGRVMTFAIVASLVPLCFHGDEPWMLAVEYICVAVFIADYIARWVTADSKLHRGAASFALYPFTPMAVIDLVSIVPTFAAINPAWRALRVLRLFRALRAFRLVRYSRSAAVLANVIVRQRKLLAAVGGLAVAYVALCALIVFNCEPQTFATFFDAVYWSVVSLTTVGYGDLYPTSEIGRAVAMVSSLMGVAIVALPSSIVTAGMMDELGKGGEENGKEK